MTTVFLVIPGLVAVWLLSELMKSYAMVALVIMGMVFSVAWEYPALPELANLAGASIYPEDVAVLALLMASARAWSETTPPLKKLLSPLLGIILILATSTLRGFEVSDVGTLVNELRPYFYALTTLLWIVVSSHPGSTLVSSLSRFSIWAGFVLVFVSCLHIIESGGLGDPTTFVDASSGIEQTSRSLTSGQALVLLLCSYVVISRAVRNHNKFLYISGALFIVFVLLSQQRTVWAAATVGVVASVLSMRGLSKVTGAIRLSVILGLVTLGASILSPGLITVILAAATDEGTYHGRQSSWADLLSRSFDRGPTSILFGQPMGSGFERFEDGFFVNYSPHNLYLAVYLRAGVFGLALLAALSLLLIGRARRSARGPSSIALVFVLLAYGWAYVWPWYALPFVAVAIYLPIEHGASGPDDQRTSTKHRNTRRASLKTTTPPSLSVNTAKPLV